MKLLITGANGQLGWELCQRKSQYDPDSFTCDLPGFNLTDQDAVKDTIQTIRPDLVINAAAYTAVDQAEKEPDKAFAVNRDGAGYLAEACHGANIPLLHISTDYVFDGTKTDPYKETDPTSPMCIYGESKAQGEEIIRKTLPRHIIIRTSWLYSVHGNNFVKTMLRVGKQNQEIRVVDDQFGCPTHAADLAQTILKIADQMHQSNFNAWGTYHFSNAGKTTWFKFARKIFEIASAYDSFSYKELTPITTDEYPTPAKRPRSTVLDCRLIAQTFGLKPIPWQESLSRMMDQFAKKNMKLRVEG